MWLKKSVHFEQHYLSKWKIIQPRALQWDLSLFLQLLKTIPEVNSSWCSCILIFCRAEKRSGPYFSTCKTNFLWLKSEFTAVSLQCFARMQHREAPKPPSCYEGTGEWGKENELIWDEHQSLYKFSGFPHGLLHQWVWMCKGDLESLRCLWWLRASCQADHVSCVPASGIPHRSGRLGFVHKLWRFLCQVVSPTSLFSLQFQAFSWSLLCRGSSGLVIPCQPALCPSTSKPSKPSLTHHLPRSIPTFSAVPVLPTLRYHSSGSGLTRPMQKDYFSFFNH